MNKYTVRLLISHPLGIKGNISYKVKADTIKKARSSAYYAFLMDYGRYWNIKEIHASGGWDL